MIDNTIRNELVLEVVIAARQEMSLKEFQRQCRTQPLENGKSFQDRMRTLEELERDRTIEQDDGYFRLSAKEVPESIIMDLKSGSKVAWDILECIDPTKRLTSKIDLELLHKIGLEGEFAVIETLKKRLSPSDIDKIKHVSLFDDSAGFDIHSPSLRNSESTVLLEVKTSPRPGPDFSFFISRNEARVAQRNENWFLLAVISTSYGYQVLGTLAFYQFSDYLPFNQDKRGQWESARISIPRDIFKKELP